MKGTFGSSYEGAKTVFDENNDHSDPFYDDKNDGVRCFFSWKNEGAKNNLEAEVYMHTLKMKKELDKSFFGEPNLIIFFRRTNFFGYLFFVARSTLKYLIG